MKLLATVSLMQMMYKYLSKWLTYFDGVSYYISEVLMEVALVRKICKWLYWNIREKKGKFLWWLPALVMMKAQVLQRY